MSMRYSMIALALILVPVAGASTAGDKSDESMLKIDLRPLNGRLIYIAEDMTLWEEANAFQGLQKARTAIGPQNVREPDVRLSGP